MADRTYSSASEKGQTHGDDDGNQKMVEQLRPDPAVVGFNDLIPSPTAGG
jgi:hypothetical protein